MRWILAAAVLLAGCEKGPKADLAAIAEARSLGAEWALINQQAAEGRLTATYTRIMRKQLREQLEGTSSSLKQPDSRYGQAIRAMLALRDAAPAVAFRRQADELQRIEDGLESD